MENYSKKGNLESVLPNSLFKNTTILLIISASYVLKPENFLYYI